MNRAAWWTCALFALSLALSHARIYERCELARDLRALGVHPDHISTWVCIAYHESRFDTAANNPHSGDHGLFQISELYWCGTGKACGLPCSALRDEDITDDLECALTVHEEHTRLQGDGFLAWVVYPQHCKHNTKKYLIDCDESIKNAPPSQGRSFNSFTSYDSRYRTKATSNNPNINDLLPPYLTVSSIFRGSYGKVLDPNISPQGGNWFNYKNDKIDELKLPDFVEKAPVSTTTTTTAITTPYVPPVKVWRVIETNQFRKKALPLDRITSIPTTARDYNFFETHTSSSTFKPVKESSTHKSFTTETIADILPKVRSSTATYKSPSTVASTIKPVNITNIAYKSPAFTTSYKSRITTMSPTTTYRSPTWSTYNYFASTAGNRFPSSTTTIKPTFPPFVFTFRTTTSKPTTISTTALSFPTDSYTYRSPSYSTTTVKPSTTTYKTRTTSKPTTTYRTTTWRPTTPWYSSTRGLGTFGSSTTTSQYLQSIRPYVTTTTKRPIFPISTQRSTYSTYTTQRPAFIFTNTQKPKYTTPTTQISTFSTSTKRSVAQSYTTLRPTTQRTTKVTQNIFDLYLHPTKRPKLPPFSFSSRDSSKFKINIFSGGTTAVPSVKSNQEQTLAERNQIRREVLA